jgi:hypothetical protein
MQEFEGRSKMHSSTAFCKALHLEEAVAVRGLFVNVEIKNTL